jgi:uncharacterized membrane protein YkvA (DUF1232 family)
MTDPDPAAGGGATDPARALTIYDPVKLGRDSGTVRRRFWAKLRRVLAAIPFAEDLVAAYYCAIDRSTPAYVRAILMGALAYFVLPADVIPDFIAGIGFTDDASVLLAAITAVQGNLKPEHRAKARAWIEARRRADPS